MYDFLLLIHPTKMELRFSVTKSGFHNEMPKSVLWSGGKNEHDNFILMCMLYPVNTAKFRRWNDVKMTLKWRFNVILMSFQRRNWLCVYWLVILFTVKSLMHAGLIVI